MAILTTLIGGAILAVVGYFVLKLTFKWVMNKLDDYFTKKDIDGAVMADIDALAGKCTNKRSYEVLKKAREKGYTHVMGKTSGGKMTGDIELIKDESKTPDPEIEDLLGPERMVIIDK